VGLDFSKLTQRSVADVAVEPSRIFSALPHRAFPYLRDVQDQVLDRWFERRAQRDVVIKMNTGAGKTVVAELILKSCLNEGVGPAVYLAADNYLVDQVLAEAAKLGIATTTDADSPRFNSGREILVINVHKLINGRSVFGVGSARIRVGSLLIDDAHACVAAAEEQFSIRLDSDHEGYGKLQRLFRDDLQRQSAAQALSIQDGDPWALLELPYWAWQEKLDEATRILHKYREEKEFGFHWPLVRSSLAQCRVVFRGDCLQITPPCLPVDALPAFTRAHRRIFMTATLPDDGVLVEAFGAHPEHVATSITPKSAADLGDRMIIAPQETHPDASDYELRELVSDFSKRVNVVVIVPSERRAQVWVDRATLTLSKANLDDGVARLKAGHVGLVVLINRYDGVDLAGDACRLLVLDGLPEAYSPMEQVEATALGSEGTLTERQILRIEQGMGRGIRANDDYCAVLLVGAKLTRHLYSPGALRRLSPGTQAQMDLSRQVAEQLENKPLSELSTAIGQCLSRQEGWVTAGRNALDGVTYPELGDVSDISIRRRRAFDMARLGQHKEAAEQLQDAVRDISDPQYRGWIKQEAAAYLNSVNTVDAQKLQLSAVQDNNALIKPISGITYARIPELALGQARTCSTFLTEQYQTPNELLLGFQSILSDLEFRENSANPFEAAMKALGLHLGFLAQRPEHETGTGPDVLWSTGELRYLVIECKSEATEDIPKKDAGQLGQSMDWFAAKYDQSCKAWPVIVHPTGRFKAGVAPPREGTHFIDAKRLAKVKEAVSSLAKALALDENFHNPDRVLEQLTAHGLMGDEFRRRFTAVAHVS